MPIRPVIKVVEHLRKTVLRQEEDTLSDGQLLDRFVEKQDEAAFSALVRRHAPMVWGVCQRIVGQAADAEDAFQAAFLILVRKAAAIKPRAAVGNWLYGVACHTALQTRTACTRVRAKEKQVTNMPESAKDPLDEREELQRLLDQELSALSDKYRLPVVLCDLEGRTRKEVAAQLKIPQGTLSSRLATAHQMLSKRLARHGLAVSGASLAALLAQNAASACVPASVVSTTIKTAAIVAAGNGVAAGVVSTKVAALTEGVLMTMFLTKLKLLGVTLTIAVLACFGIGGAIQMYAGERVEASERNPVRINGVDDELHLKRSAVREIKEPTTELERLHGVWTLVETYKNGKKVAARDIPIEPHKLTIDAYRKSKTPRATRTLNPVGAVVYHADGSNEEEGHCEVNAATNPKVLTLTWLLVRQWVCIYKIEGDTLTICFNPKDFIRPDEFLTAAESDRMVFVYQRVKASQEPQLKKSDFEELQGKWVSVACEMQGTEFKGKQLQDFHFDPSFDGKKYVIQFGKIRMEGTFELDPTNNPKKITLKSADGGTNLGIYTFDGDQLLICIGDKKKDGRRPTEFKTKAGSGHSLIRFNRVSRKSEVREVVDQFLKSALAGEVAKTRELTAPTVSDEQLARFKGLTKKLPIANVYVTPGAAPTSHGDNTGRALVVTDEIEVTDGQRKTKGRVMLTLLKDDERLKAKGWLVWDIDLADEAQIERGRKFIDRTQPKPEDKANGKDQPGSGNFGPESNGLRCRLVGVPTTADDESPDITKTTNAFARGDDVAFAVELQNVSGKPLPLLGVRYGDNYPAVKGKLNTAFLGPHLFDFEFTDASGKPVPRTSRVFFGMYDVVRGASMHEIAPGKTLVMLLRPARLHAPMDHQLPPGTYHAKIRYRGLSDKSLAYFRAHLPDKPQAKAWSGEVESNQVAFTLAKDPAATKAAKLVWGDVNDGLQAAFEFRSLPWIAPANDLPGTLPTKPRVSTIFHVKNVSDRVIRFVSETGRQGDEVTLTNEAGETKRLEGVFRTGEPIFVRWTLKPGEVAELSASTAGVGLIDQPGKYTMRYKINFANLAQKGEFGFPQIPQKDDWQNVLATGDTPVTIRARTPEDDAREKRASQPKAP